MSREKDPECRGFVVGSTENAVQVAKDWKGTGEKWWIPRSQIGYCRKTTIPETGAIEIVFTIPEWLIEKKQCLDLVP